MIDSLILNQKIREIVNVHIIFDMIHNKTSNANKNKFVKFENIENKSTLAQVKIKKSGMKNQ